MASGFEVALTWGGQWDCAGSTGNAACTWECVMRKDPRVRPPRGTGRGFAAACGRSGHARTSVRVHKRATRAADPRLATGLAHVGCTPFAKRAAW
jgi:hypothetical protein